jgi:methylamine dehydrogenase heavy chain
MRQIHENERMISSDVTGLLRRSRRAIARVACRRRSSHAVRLLCYERRVPSAAASRLAWLLLVVAAAVIFVGGAPAARADDVAEPVGQVMTLPDKPRPHWFWLGDVLLHRTALFDGDSAQLLGTIAAGSPGVGFAILPLFPPDHSKIYIPESYFSRGVRGERSDVVTAYDPKTLNPDFEIAIPPKRAEYFPGVAANAISDDGRFVAVFNATPAQSLSIVDLQSRQTTTEVQTPGCSLVYAAGPRRFFMLCADGAALVVTLDDAGQQRSAERTAPFFDPEKDPLFETGGRSGDVWTFASFEGRVRTVDVSGDTPVFGEPWSLFSDADRKEQWRVGGGQPLALQAKSGRLFVLVHQGGVDTHKQAGSEIWAYDVKRHERVLRFPVANGLASFLRGEMRLGHERLRDRMVSWLLDHVLPNLGAEALLVTQDDQPILVVMAMVPPAVTIHDPMSGALLREVAEPGLSGSVLVAP